MASVATAIATARHWPRFTQQLLWVIGCFALTVVPHIGDVSPWLLVLATATVAWRVTVELRQWRLPHKWIRIGAAFGSMLIVLATYRTLNGLEAGTAFLVVMGAMKLLETQSKRDLTIVLFVSYFLQFAGFLYDQQLLLLPYMLLTTWLLTATLMRIHQSSAMEAREALGTTGKMFLQALPLAALLFVFFPRLPGQFWAMPAREQARTGLDDEVSPGDVSELSVSSAMAFRVRFDSGELPPNRERYWRGPVLHEFDGRTWRRTTYPFVDRTLVPTGPIYKYRLMAEPSNRAWIFGLDAVTSWPRNARRTSDYQMVANRPISTLSAFDLESATNYRIEGELPNVLRTAALRLPQNRNPRSNEFARTLRAQVQTDEEFVAAVLKKFREEEYFYTLEPPRLESNSVDDFLFNTRRGFCEHFASAFTALARAAGIPARVVVGYQGGEFNPMSGYLLVRQSDAHAWSEIWIDGKGWIRIDPTAAVAPERVERGIDAALSDEEAVPGRIFMRNTLLSQLRNAWDAANTLWNDQIVKFGQQQQRSLLSLIGIENADWEELGMGLGLTLIGFFVALSGYLALRYRPPQREPLVHVYEQLCRRLARQNLPREHYEGPNDYLQRVAKARPELASQLNEVRTLYVSLRYGPGTLGSQLSRLKFLINQLKV